MVLGLAVAVAVALVVGEGVDSEATVLTLKIRHGDHVSEALLKRADCLPRVRELYNHVPMVGITAGPHPLGDTRRRRVELLLGLSQRVQHFVCGRQGLVFGEV